MEGLGFSKTEVVKELSVKAHVSERTIYNDFENRMSWQPINEAKYELYRIINLYNQIYRKAAYKYLSSQNESVQLGALKVMLEIAKQLNEVLVVPELMNRLEHLEEKVAKHK
jgi:transcriptional antiterminator